MSRKSKQKNNNSAFSRTDYLCVLPGILMCAIILIMLLMDLALPEMSEFQYQSFPQLFRGANILICISGILFLVFYCSSLFHKKNELDLAAINWLLFGAFYICIILSTIVNGLDDKAIHGVSFRDIGIFHILAFIAFYMGLSSHIKSKAMRMIEILIYIGTSDFVAVAALIDKYFWPIAAFREKKDLSAVFFNGNHYGYFLVMAILVALGLTLCSDNKRIRVFSAVSMILNGSLLVMNGSAGCMVALTVSVIFAMAIFFKSNKNDVSHNKIAKIALISLLLILIMLACVTGIAGDIAHSISAIISNSEDASSAGHNRWLLWSETCKYIAQKPILGYGCEGLSDILMDSLGRANPHNEMLSYASEFGIPAAVLYTAAVIIMIFSSIKDLSTLDDTHLSALLAAFGYFISSFFGVPMFYTLPFFFIFLGLSISPRKI